MKILGLISLVLLLATTTWAKDVGLDDIMDAYLLAKADVGSIELEPKNVQKEPYTIQVAAYLSEQDAIRHVQELKKSQQDVFYFTNFARGQIWYKVSVGRFADMVKAERFRKKFVKKMEEPFAVVIDLKGKTPERKTASVEDMKVEKKKTAVPVPGAGKSDTAGMQVAMMKKDKAKNTDTTAVATTMAPPTVTDYLYSLQIGAFATEKEAQNKANTLQVTETAYVTTAVVNGKTWYRVLVGKFETKREAEVFRASYKQQTQDSAAFIKRLAK